MQATSEVYARILTRDDYTVRRKAVVAGVEYNEGSGLVQMTKSHMLYAGNGPGVGGTAAAEYSLAVLAAGEIPRLAPIALYVQLQGGGEVSEWIPKGTGYSATRQKDQITGVTHITGFDALLLAEGLFFPDGEIIGKWPRKAPDVVADICARLKVRLDARTVLRDYDVELPSSDATMRSVLGYIAAQHAANWTMTDAGALYLVPLVPTGDRLDLQDNMASLLTEPEFQSFSKVQFYYSGKDTYSAGDESGRILEIECPWGTQAIADAALAAVTGYVYRPYDAEQAIFDPAAELGDPVRVNGVDSVLAVEEMAFDLLCSRDISAPSEDAVENDFGFSNRTLEQSRRELAEAKAEIRVGVDEINATVNGVKGEVTSVSAKVDSIRFSVSDPIDGGTNRYVNITLTVGDNAYTGVVMIDGNVDVSGQLSAEALYATLGDIARLKVDSLSTSRRIPMYLARDTEPDYYIDIQEQHLALRRAWTDGSTEQARDDFGAKLYWEQDVEDADIGSDGYPYVDGARVFITTEVTDWPVIVYSYESGDRLRITFEEDGNYGPRMVWGEGRSDGTAYGRGFIEKLDVTFGMYNYGTDGVKRGIFMSNEFTDVVGERRLSKASASGDTLTLTFEGDVTKTLTFGKNASGNYTSVTCGGFTTTLEGF